MSLWSEIRHGRGGPAAILLLAGLAPLLAPDVRGAAPRAPSAPDLRTARVVDLTHPFDERTPYWPTAPSGFKLERVHYGRTDAGYFYSAYSFCAPEHGGTHLDAPIHFGEGRWTADQIPVDRLVRPAAVIDVAVASAADADHQPHRRGAEGVGSAPWPHRGGPSSSCARAWSARWLDKASATSATTPRATLRALHFPSYGPDAVRILVTERKVAALGVDTASIDPRSVEGLSRAPDRGRGQACPGSRTWPASTCRPTGAWVVALPMKIANGSGGPLRAIALVNLERRVRRIATSRVITTLLFGVHALDAGAYVGVLVLAIPFRHPRGHGAGPPRLTRGSHDRAARALTPSSAAARSPALPDAREPRPVHLEAHEPARRDGTAACSSRRSPPVRARTPAFSGSPWLTATACWAGCAAAIARSAVSIRAASAFRSSATSHTSRGRKR